MLFLRTGSHGHERPGPFDGHEDARSATIGRLAAGEVGIAVEMQAMITRRVSYPPDLDILLGFQKPAHEAL